MSAPGSPYLYYGEEIGMLGKKPDQNIREPLIWDNKENDKIRTTWIKPRFSTDSTIVSVNHQLTDNNSLLNYYKSFIKLRNTSYALTYGDLLPVNQSNPAICAFIRSDEKESLLVLHNLSAKNQAFRLQTNQQEYNELYFMTKEAQMINKQILLPAYSMVIIKNSPNKRLQ
jgi:glycosidase